jgi:uncharacterized protein YecT (DUF1311 family)
MKAIAVLLLAAAAGAASAGVLQQCKQSAPDGARVLACLRGAHAAATDEMLESFLGAEQSFAALGAREAERAGAALKQSQRAFERYVLEFCHGVAATLANASEATVLACETDLLRQRAQSLATLVEAQDRT